MRDLNFQSVEDTLPTLSSSGRELMQMIMKGAEDNFRRDGHLVATLFLMHYNDKVIMSPLPEWRNDYDKDRVMEKVRVLQANFPLSAMIVEVWASSCQGEWDGTRPSQDPNREEAAALTFFEGHRRIFLMAQIERNPNRLAQWKVMHDTAFSKDKCGLQGRMVEGSALPTEDN